MLFVIFAVVFLLLWATLYVALPALRHPIAFSRGWSEGHEKAMNPIAFYGAALGLSLGAKAIADHFFPSASVPDDTPMLCAQLE